MGQWATARRGNVPNLERTDLYNRQAASAATVVVREAEWHSTPGEQYR